MGKRTSSFGNFPYDTEQLRITKNSISVRINVISGKDGEYWICISPSIDVSGYGKSIEEAKTSFDENMDVFFDDLIVLPSVEKKTVLREMGWRQKRYLKKQFSKAFVDEDGILQNLKQPRLVSLETIA